MTSLCAARQLVPLQEQIFIVLSNSCFAVEHLLRNELVHGRILAGAESTGKCLLGLFVLLYLETGPDFRLDCEPRGYISICTDFDLIYSKSDCIRVINPP